MNQGAVIVPGPCELQRCTPHQAHELLLVYIWCGVGVSILILAVWLLSLWDRRR